MTHPKWLLRKLSTADLETFRLIRLEALRCAPGSFASCYDDWIALTVAEWLERMRFPIFVASIDDEPVGMMGLKRQEPRKMRHRAMLTMVYVRQAMRGSGLAGALLHDVLNYARQEEIAQIELVVRSDNYSAIRFYRREGFVEVGVIPDGFLDTERSSGEIIMVNQLRSNLSELA